MRALLIQLNIRWEDKLANCARVEALVSKAAPEPGSLVVLPEMFATGFTMNVNLHGEPPEGEIHRRLSELARKHQCTIVAGVACGRGSVHTNEAWVYAPSGRRQVEYAKIHLFRPGGEASHYREGTRLCRFSWKGLKVVPFICYDLRFPELFRLATGQGAEVFVVIASWPAPRHSHWRTLLQARAIENQAYVIGVNRCGTDPKHTYLGGSMLVSPRGEIVAEAGRRECALWADLEGNEMRQWRRDFPVLDDRRIRVGPGVGRFQVRSARQNTKT